MSEGLDLARICPAYVRTCGFVRIDGTCRLACKHTIRAKLANWRLHVLLPKKWCICHGHILVLSPAPAALHA